MEDDLHPGASSQVEDTLRPATASESLIVVAPTPENAGQKWKIANLEAHENLELVKRGKTLHIMINLLNNVEELMSEDDRNNLKDDDHTLDVTLILGQDCLHIGYVALEKALDSNNVQYDDYLHMPKKLGQLQGVNGAREDVNDNRTTQLMAQAQQLQDLQNRIDTLHMQLFDL
ncbi:hypothetical protein DFH29DRAFT_1003500 [Suillus ampliporus]|nr:hypothetical protein DFH29DRAFT_1003500 [Suillus ampliporus]